MSRLKKLNLEISLDLIWVNMLMNQSLFWKLKFDLPKSHSFYSGYYIFMKFYKCLKIIELKMAPAG